MKKPKFERVSDEYLMADIAEEQLTNLAKIDGGKGLSRRWVLPRLIKFMYGIPSSERMHKNRRLDAPNKRGYIRSHDIAPLMRERSRRKKRSK